MYEHRMFPVIELRFQNPMPKITMIEELFDPKREFKVRKWKNKPEYGETEKRDSFKTRKGIYDGEW